MYIKQRENTLYWLQEKSKEDKLYIKTIEAFHLAEKYHNGFRKDGITKEFQHQLNIVNNLIHHLQYIEHPAETLTVAFLHDLIEDYGIKDPIWDKDLERLKGLSPIEFDFIKKNYSILVVESLDAISKKVDGKKKKKKKYFSGIENLSIASIVKLADRIDNLNSMLNVFSEEKQIAYALEARIEFLSFLQKSRNLFPSQIFIYNDFEKKINSVINLVDEKEKKLNKKSSLIF